MWNFADKPGQLYVVATLLPLASFFVILLASAVRSALRQSTEGTLGWGLYQLLGGDRPPRWPAFVATLAIGGACVLSVIGFVRLQGDHHKIEELQVEITQAGRLHRDLLKRPNNETPDARKQRQALAKDAEKRLDDLRENRENVEKRWRGSYDWVSLTVFEKEPDARGVLRTRMETVEEDDKEVVRPVLQKHGTALRLGYKIDHLSAVMFVMVTFIATLIHIFSAGYMAEEKNKVVEDHQVHGEDGHYRRRGRFGRFFMFLSLFCFSMLNLILADNLFQVFLSWELVGICSYLLIGYYLERPSASNAANKAFIVNRVGDAGFIVGLLIIWTYFGTFNFDEIFGRVRSPARDSHGLLGLSGRIVKADPVPPAEEGEEPSLRVLKPGDPISLDTQAVIFPRVIPDHFHGAGYEGAGGEEEVTPAPYPGENDYTSMPYWVLVLAGLGIFLGCVGKSAQVPLHVWLPDAMEGPTPVSALIHAATMVAAGVYLVGRAYPLFTPEVLLVIAYTGAITLFVAATVAVVLTDIKKVLAYSTVSQLGYMMLALGIGGWAAGLFHLVTHAFFKALLFLGSGSVIHGCHHEQDMTKMGGLYPKMRITALTMLMGVLAISGIPAFSGWYSKDAIVATALGYVHVHPQHTLLFILPLVTAGLTTFYMFRMWLMTFTGKPRDQHVYEHAHESPPLMTGPLIVLAVFSVCVAWGWPFVSPSFPFVDAETSVLEHQIHHAQPQSVLADFGSLGPHGGEEYVGSRPVQREDNSRLWAVEYHHLAGNLALGVVVLGMVFAFLVYYYRTLDASEASGQFPGLNRFLAAKWYFDELYSAALVRPALVLAGWCKAIDLRVIDRALDGSAHVTVRVAQGEGRFDNGVIDGLVNLVATVAYGIAGWFRSWQTGYLRSYMLFLVLAAVGLFVLLSYFMA